MGGRVIGGKIRIEAGNIGFLHLPFGVANVAIVANGRSEFQNLIRNIDIQIDGLTYFSMGTRLMKSAQQLALMPYLLNKKSYYFTLPKKIMHQASIRLEAIRACELDTAIFYEV